jgi:rod shape-determining protein MreC
VRNFILFIRRFFNLILFIALEVLCIVLIGRTQMMQGVDIMSSANALSGKAYQKQQDVVYYFGLKRMNDSLINENARLRNLMAKSSSFDSIKDSAVTLAVKPTDTTQTIQYNDYIFRTARVINNSVASGNNFITINRGSKDGIKKGQAVISGTGVVGRVEYVSDHYASVLSVLSVKQKVSAKLKDGTFSAVTWEGDNPDIMHMENVPQQIKIHKNDSVFTTSYSFFPSDILIGTVVKLKKAPKNNMQTLYLKTATNFRNLQYVYVIENKMMAERLQLEDSAKLKKK